MKIEKENVLKAYKDGGPDIKKLLQQLFGDILTPKDIKDVVKTFQDACNEIGESTDDVEECSLSKDKKSIQAYAKLCVITRALNEGWEPDWTNSSEYKYYPYFDMSSGSGLSSGDCDFRYSRSSVGSRLCFKSKELAIYAAKQFESIYKDYFII